MGGLRPHDILLIVLGAVVILFAFVPGLVFYFRPAATRWPGQKPIPRWFGRAWFIVIGALMIYLGLKR